MVGEGNETGHAAAAAVERVADGGDDSCHDPLLNTGKKDSWKDSLKDAKGKELKDCKISFKYYMNLPCHPDMLAAF